MCVCCIVNLAIMIAMAILVMASQANNYIVNAIMLYILSV